MTCDICAAYFGPLKFNDTFEKFKEHIKSLHDRPGMEKIKSSKSDHKCGRCGNDAVKFVPMCEHCYLYAWDGFEIHIEEPQE